MTKFKSFLPSMTQQLILQPEAEPHLQLQILIMEKVSRLLNACRGKEELLLMWKRTVTEVKEP